MAKKQGAGTNVGGNYFRGHEVDQTGIANKGTIIHNNKNVTVNVNRGSEGSEEGDAVTITNDVSGNQIFNINLQDPRAEEVLKIVDGLIDRGLVSRSAGVSLKGIELPRIEEKKKD